MKYITPIKQIAAALTCGLLTLTLVGCQQNGTTEPAASPSTTDPTSKQHRQHCSQLHSDSAEPDGGANHR